MRGYTLVEILVVIIITATMSGILVLYSRTSEQQIILFRDQAKLIGMIFRAKSLAVTSKTTIIDIEGVPNEIIPCAYGFNFNRSDKTFRIFREFDQNGKNENCLTPDLKPNYIYNPGEDMSPEEIQILGENVEVAAITNLENIVFIPPEPKVYINGSEIFTNASIIIETLTGIQKTVKINNFGQITSQ